MSFFPFAKPVLENGGHVSVQTSAAGTTLTAFASQPCVQLTIANDTGITLEFSQDGGATYLPVFDSTYYTVFGLNNASQISVRRKDTLTTQVTVKARWES